MASRAGQAEGPLLLLGSATQNLRLGLKSFILHHSWWHPTGEQIGGKWHHMNMLCFPLPFPRCQVEIYVTSISNHVWEFRSQNPLWRLLQPLHHHAKRGDQNQAYLQETSTQNHNTPLQWWGFISWCLQRNNQEQSSWYS